jgi:demethoxyubiquinone hydroxylase (CLK1/Coq7/Cat5 family)
MESPAPTCTVYFDGACPLCQREIAHYRRLPGAEGISWVDASTCDAASLGAGLDRSEALARLHVRRGDGSLVSGAAAFAAIWSRLPAYAFLGRLASWRPVLSTMEAAYVAFLRVRRLWRRPEQERARASPLPQAILRDLRTNHAGEVGAVRIYRGILAVAPDPAVRQFAARHLATELLHLRRIRHWVPQAARSRLLPLWRVAGWLTGALPALFGPRAVYATIAAVEHFVDRHYAQQIERLGAHPELAELRDTLEACRRDEVEHRDEASACLQSAPGWRLRTWSAVVGKGSELAVAASRLW